MGGRKPYLSVGFSSRPATSHEPRVAAFFDMDKTIIAENSGSVYMKRRFERGEIGPEVLLAGLASYFQYKLGVLDIEAFTKSMWVEFKDRREAELFAEGRELFEERLRPLIYPRAAAQIREHRLRGHVVCIGSGATPYVIEPLVRHLGIRHYLCTQLEEAGGRLTGRVVEPICFEEGKVHWVRQWIDEIRVDMARSYFYTDSITDRALLEGVGHPVAVNPDPRLYRLARHRRWPIRLYDLD